MRTKLNTIEDIKSVLSEAVINKTDKITKISDQSVFNAFIYAIARLEQKNQKDSALVESELFPESAVNTSLDLVSLRQGLSTRYGPSAASTYVKVWSEPGTRYTAEDNVFINNEGVQFRALKDWTVSNDGYKYVLVRSIQKGYNQNITPNSINQILDPPIGHYRVTNEFTAVGGTDVEPDDIFKNRIIQGFNILATDTLARLEQLMMNFNQNILKVRKLGKSSKGESRIAVSTIDGSSLTDSEIADLYDYLKYAVGLSDLRTLSNDIPAIIIENIDYTTIDIDFRVDLYDNVSLDTFKIKAQGKIFKYIDWRVWGDKDVVEWDDMFQLIKSLSEVRYIPDQYFNPRKDIAVAYGTLPRIQSFVIRDLNGEVLLQNDRNTDSEALSVFYQRIIDQDYQSTVLSNI